jgi:diaminopropionate ammonia-lyase
LKRTVNPHRDRAYAPAPVEDGLASGGPRAFHRTLPGYAPTPLVAAPELAREWGVGSVYLKDESARFGLPSFKVLGASWAIECALRRAQPRALVCATDGNHGRAVAWEARRRGLRAEVLVPAGTAPARIDAIRGEGAQVEVVDGDYDEAVRRSARRADGVERLLVSDTSWPGYEEIPQWVIEGYATIFAELAEQLPEPAGTVFVPVGVGALAAAAARALRPDGARLVAVEPEGADCLRRSIAAGEPVTVPGPHTSKMAGLNCGTPSVLAWPVLRAAFDEFVAIPDAAADEGMRRLAALGLDRGECAGGVAGAARQALGEDRGGGGAVVLLLTEGVTDPVHFEEVVGRPPGRLGAR